MNLLDLQQILITLGAEIRLSTRNKMFVVQLSSDADKTIVMVADQSLERAVDIAIARFIEIRHATAAVRRSKAVES